MRRSTSQTGTEYPSARLPHQRLMCSGLLIASNTRCRGALNSRVKWISVSVGVVTLKVSLFATPVAAMFLLLFLLRRLQLLQVEFEVVEACLPDAPEVFRPVRDLLQR